MNLFQIPGKRWNSHNIMTFGKRCGKCLYQMIVCDWNIRHGVINWQCKSNGRGKMHIRERKKRLQKSSGVVLARKASGCIFWPARFDPPVSVCRSMSVAFTFAGWTSVFIPTNIIFRKKREKKKKAKRNCFPLLSNATHTRTAFVLFSLYTVLFFRIFAVGLSIPSKQYLHCFSKLLT